jgi:cytochrome c553
MLKTIRFYKNVELRVIGQLLFLSLSLIVSMLPASDDTQQAQESAQQAPQIQTIESCAACHGSNGQGPIASNIPKLAGQHQNYLELQLEHFAQGASGPRDNPIMSALAAELTAEQRASFSAFYSAQKRSYMSTPQRADLVQGERLYKGGDEKKMIMACSACHQPTGSGYQPGRVPALAGQYAEYLIEQLQQYRSGGRYHSMMTPLAQRLSDEQIEAVAYYLQGVQQQ